jgi:hypothetical protein
VHTSSRKLWMYESIDVLGRWWTAYTSQGKLISSPQRLPSGAQGGPPGGLSMHREHTCSRISARYSVSPGLMSHPLR